jgi:hypothetical protein
MMDFALFILLNAVLLIRPEEIQPDLAGLRLYLLVMAACLVANAPRILSLLNPAELASRPITACVLGFWCAGMLTEAARGQLGLAADFAGEFGKVILYYLVLISVLDSPARIRAFLACLVGLVLIIATLGLLQHRGIIDIEAMRPLERVVDADAEDPDFVLQLRGTGIYNDPNDLCLILVTGSLAALCRSATATGFLARILWLLPIGLFGYCVMLTQSRGGVLGLGVAGLVWASSRFGWKKGLLATIILFPAFLALSGGRQSNISLGSDDTAHERAMYWSEGMVAMKRNPFTGIGVNEYVEEVGHVAHNSFVHAFVETGLLGGGLFLGAFALSAVGLYLVRPTWSPALVRLRPFILAMVVGYAGGIFSLSRNYIAPTYMVLGLAEAFLMLARPAMPIWFRLDGRLVFWLAGLAIVGFIGLKIVTMILLRMG